MNHKLSWDIFCAVVDNYGDIGVCWRLSRQLSMEHGMQVRLWVDDLTALAKLHPDVEAARDSQRIDGVEVRHWSPDYWSPDYWSPDYWSPDFHAPVPVDAADVVIEAFACELPDACLAAMAQRATPPVWINLDYLSAEDWVEGAHGLASPHPRLPLIKYFFFPGFTPGTGGLIREADYRERRMSFDEPAFRVRLGLPHKRASELTISLFGYENAALPSLLDAWTKSPVPITCLVPDGCMVQEVERFLGRRDAVMQRGALTACTIPFLTQRDYDALLWLCDLNFVRGEDSLVRAQWAEKPLVWQLYPQPEAAHMVKLAAFLHRYLPGMPAPIADTARNFWTVWNAGGDAGAQWPAFARALPALQAHGRDWSKNIAAPGDLAANLLNFVREKARK